MVPVRNREKYVEYQIFDYFNYLNYQKMVMNPKY